jgi:autotransporter translocation and assembly factor TamB
LLTRNATIDERLPAGVVTSQPSVLFTAQGHADAKVLTVLDPAVQAAGSLDLNVKADGSLARPNLSGILTVHNLGIGYGDLPLRVPGLNGEIKLEGERATISYLRGASGPSVISLSGYVILSGTPGYDLHANLDHARIGFPAEFTQC